MAKLTAAIVASGEMGAFIGATLSAHGARVLTAREGRSETSLQRARIAGFELVEREALLVEAADVILSVVPPNAALGLATRFEPILSASGNKPVYIDCNAVAPETVKRIESQLAGTGCSFVDGALFGGPTSGKPGVTLYVSGASAPETQALGNFGLVIRTIKGGVGAASAMKLSFAAINKGFTALGALALLAAVRSSSQDALIEQLEETQPGLLAYVSRFVPAMFPKAYRWAPEMEEIASFLNDDAEAREVFQALARTYRRLAKDAAPVERGEVAALRAVCKAASERSAASTLGKK